LKVARELQVGLLPTEAPVVDGLAIASLAATAETVGGDWYDYLTLADGSWGIVIGDVSGHEVGAALVMTQTRAYLRAAAGATADPGVLLTRVNKFLIKDVRDRRFVGLFVAVLRRDGTIDYAAAGLTAVVFNVGGVVRELSATGPVLGVEAQPIPCGSAFTLGPGEALLLATDGWEEARNSGGEFFGQLRMLETLGRTKAEPPLDRLQELLAAVQRFCQPRPPQDDLTAVLIQSVN
jgi:sigma-B regulation protein RsbU (phosphoserine phosphatase)